MKSLFWVLTFAFFSLLINQQAIGETLFDARGSEEHFQKAMTFYYQENYPSALEEFKTAISINPDNVKARYYLGYTHYETGNFTEALKWFDNAYQINTNYTPIPTVPNSASFTPFSK